MKYYFDELKIIGVKNPYLYIGGWVRSNNYKLSLISNDKEIAVLSGNIYRKDVGDFFDEKKQNKYGFFNAIKLSNKDYKIKILLIEGKKTIEIKTIKGIIFKRLTSKIKNDTEKVILKIKKIVSLFLQFAKFVIKNPKIFLDRDLLKFVVLGYKKELYEKKLDLNNIKDYTKWLKKHEKFNAPKKLKYNPLISIVIPVYNAPKKDLDACINSILNQTYKNFEICLADDCSPKEEVRQILNEYVKKDFRIKVFFRQKNGNISAATNSALKIATGEFIALVDNDDTLMPNALYEVVKVLNKFNGELDFIYSDEDKLDLKGRRCEPHFKADWSPDTLLSINYITHFAVLRKSIVDKIGGFRTKCDGAQDYDMFLRFTEKTTTERIYHIDKVLYNWRKSLTSTALAVDSKSYAYEAGRLALEDALKRRKIKGTANIFMNTSYYVNYDYSKNKKVSIIILTKDKVDMLKKCIESVYKYTNKERFEIILVNNSSKERRSFNYFRTLREKYSNIKILEINSKFNYSMLNNIAVKESRFDILLFLNNDIEIKGYNWLEILQGFAEQKHIGAVGPELLYKNNTIQHAGVILGMGRQGIASHPFVGMPMQYGGPFSRIIVPYNYSAVTGACLMIEKKKFKKVGGFDENLFVNYNDVDLCIKLLKNNYYNVFVPQIKIYHYESMTRGYDNSYEKKLELYNEVKYFKSKWGNKQLVDKFYNKNYSLVYPFMLRDKSIKK